MSVYPPLTVLTLSLVAGYIGICEASRIEEENEQKGEIKAPTSSEERMKVYREMQDLSSNWSARMDNAVGVFCLASAASAVQSTYPFIYSLSALFSIGAIAPIIAGKYTPLLSALRKKKNKSEYESGFVEVMESLYKYGIYKRGRICSIGLLSLYLSVFYGAYEFIKKMG